MIRGSILSHMAKKDVVKKQTTTSSCTEKMVIVHKQDLPLSCPQQGATLWNAHPKVYLPIESSGQETCPYCGTCYIYKHD